MNRKPKSDLNPTIPELNPNGYAQDHPKAAEYITETRSYKLITPLFGGGVEAGVNDPITPIRASGIRGQLRFWWRAIRGGSTDPNLSDSQRLDDMRQREGSIWGSASTANNDDQSMISLHVTVGEHDKGTIFPAKNHKNQPIHIGHPQSTYGYAAFPLNESRGEVTQDIRFTITINYPKTYREDVEATLWAWETFGGVGGRTRRGFGSLMLEEFYIDEVKQVIAICPSSIPEAKRWLYKKIQLYTKDRIWPSSIPIPNLAAKIRIELITVHGGSAIAVWKELIDELKAFRQQRKKVGAAFGKNRWPEPDYIRHLTNASMEKHRNSNPIKKFPRAAFGLPIIFEFKKDDQRLGDPAGKYTLQGSSIDGTVKYERLSSPLIIKPIPINGGFVGLAIILAGSWLPEMLVLNTQSSKKSYPVQSELEPTEASSIKDVNNNQPLLGKTTNVLEAFMDYLIGA